MEKKGIVFLAFSLAVVFSVSLVFAQEVGITGQVITGKAVNSDLNVSVNIVGFFTINITSPENSTYLFNAGENYTVDLNVTTAENVTNWWYKLENSTGVVNDSVLFVPNSTVTGVEGYNRLTVTANSTSGALATDTVVFTISVNNTSPVIGYIPGEFLTCEGDSFFYTFNVTDNEGGEIEITLSDTNPFFVSSPVGAVEPPLIESEIFSDVLDKSDASGNAQYNLTVSVSDGEYSDSAGTNITIIEINNNLSVETLGAKSVWAYGVENRTFYEVVEISDAEDGNQDSGNFSYNLTFLNGVDAFFNISNTGVINFFANESYLGSENASVVYNMSLCVTDNGLSNPHVNISDVCSVTGENNTVCQDWSLTVTAQNRAPRIESYYPSSLSFGASGTETLEFNISEIDPDGTYPDARWYVSGSLVELDSGSLTDYFSYTFGCGVGGEKIVGVNVSDGDLSDYLEWNVSISEVACPQASPGGS
ncbi:MAG: hypothetical protein KC506_02615, partial [Nanoarchaeota archaeon]|nr:hypothetical protein [Nanoarchaeota archaeon]